MRVPRACVCALLGVGLSLAAPAVALAHASFVRSEPPDLCGPLVQPRVQPNDPRCQTGVVLDQAPAAVRITFSEPVQPVGRGIRVLSPSGKQVQQGKATAEDDAASVPIQATEQGTYVVDWQVDSSDTHPVRGRFAFSVGQPSQPATAGTGEVGQVTPIGLALQTLGRWLHFAGFALAFGTVGVGLILTRFAPEELPSPRIRWRLTSAGILLLVLSEPLMLLGQTGSLGLDQMFDGDAIGDALASLFGRLLGFRLAAALLLWVIGGSLQPPLVLAQPDEDGPPAGMGQAHAAASGQVAGSLGTDEDGPPAGVNQRLAGWAAVGLGLAVAVIDALGQHAASFRPDWLGLIVHGLHLAGMGLWLACLSWLMMSWKEGRPLRCTRRIVLTSLAIIGVTGLAMAVVHIPNPGALLSTYGEVLWIKQVVLAPALILGWLAMRRRQRRPAWMGEIAALSGVLVLAGLLVSLPPPR
ncbi:MAG TPA: copper resistance protein CopC [Chloroflexota bacterium]|nr:copper resistance protein CopC [Chloroflexota bacterium]